MYSEALVTLKKEKNGFIQGHNCIWKNGTDEPILRARIEMQT